MSALTRSLDRRVDDSLNRLPLRVLQVLTERVEPSFPERLVLGQPLIGDLKGTGKEPVQALPPVLALADETGTV